MTQRTWYRIFSVLLMAGLLLGLLNPFGALAGYPLSSLDEAAAPPTDGLAKVESLVLEQLKVESQTDYFIWMAEKADLSPAEKLTTKEAKGEFVYNTLVETAARTQKDVLAYLESQGSDYQSFYIANKVLVKGGSLTLLETIAVRPDVGKITANHEFQLQEPFKNPNPPAHTEAVEPNITFVKATDVWALGVNGSGTVMAGNDTGLMWNHPAIINKYRGWNGSVADHNYNWWDATGTYPAVPGDGHGHGTHTTGTMVGDDGVGNQIGMAPGAQTVHCKNMTDGGSGNDTTFTTCFQWDLAPWDLSGANPMPSLAPDAINNSWGYWGGNAPQFEDEIAALQAAGVAVEVSAGNEGSGCSSLRSPGDYEQVITTGSVNHANPFPGTMTGFSSRGPSALYPSDYFPDVTAPGENIRSSVPGGGYQGGWSGTSMSGPHVTALIGLMWSAAPSLRGQVDQTYQIIYDTAVPVTSYVGACGGDYVNGPNNDWGFGTIDSLAAVQLAIAMGGAGYIDGTVTDAVTSMPIEGVAVDAENPDGFSWGDTSDPTGYYTITVATGVFTVTASHPQYMPSVQDGVVVVTDTTTTVDFALTPRGHLTGYVTDYDNGFPLEATVTAEDGSTTTTDPGTGYYELYLDPGSYLVTATATHYLDGTATVVMTSGVETQQDFALMAEVAFAPDPIEVSLDLGSTGSRTATITNRQAVDYDFEFLEIPGDFTPLPPGSLGGIEAAWPGPDGFGYLGEAVDFEWIDISTTGTLVPGLSDDSFAGPFPVGFTFNHYDTDRTQFYISSNGHIDFGAGSTSLSNQCPLPNSSAPDNLIPLMWDDLLPNYSTGGVYYQTFDPCPVGAGACLVVAYEEWGHYGGGVAGTFEAVLFDNGSILMQVLDSGNESGSGSTTGNEGANYAGDYGLTYACDSAGSLADNTAMCFVYPDSAGCVAGEVPWFGQEPITGTVPAGSTLDVTLHFSATVDAGVIDPGDYSATLLVKGQPGLRVPVLMHVADFGMEMSPEAATLTGMPGETVTYTLELTNTGSVTDTYDLAILDAEWATSLPVSSVTLGAGESTEVWVNVTVAVDALAGEMDVATLTATSQAVPSQSASAELTTIADAAYALELLPDTMEASAAPGEMVTYTLTLFNTGNITDTFDLTVTSGWDFELPVASVELAPGEGVYVDVQILVPGDADDGDVDVASVTATSQGDATVSGSAELTTTADVPWFKLFLPIGLKD